MLSKSPKTRSTTAVDRALGLRIRLARQAAKLSQTALGDALGVTFQQIQKYEKGVNRVPVARLMTIARTLGTSFAALAHDAKVAHDTDAGPDPTLVFLADCKPAQRLLDIVKRLQHDGRGEAVMALVRTAEALASK